MKVRERIYIGLGSNVGNRLEFLRRAVRALRQLDGVRLLRVSRAYETSPVGPSQRSFLNAVAEIHSSLTPEALLSRLKSVETTLGRLKRKRWGPREIDLDLLLFGQWCARQKNLVVPHPRWKERKFVLWPLAELAPRLKDPATGATVLQLCQKLTDPDQTIRLYRWRIVPPPDERRS